MSSVESSATPTQKAVKKLVLICCHDFSEQNSDKRPEALVSGHQAQNSVVFRHCVVLLVPK